MSEKSRRKIEAEMYRLLNSDPFTDSDGAEALRLLGLLQDLGHTAPMLNLDVEPGDIGELSDLVEEELRGPLRLTAQDANFLRIIKVQAF